jgi:hypothetical protein
MRLISKQTFETRAQMPKIVYPFVYFVSVAVRGSRFPTEGER